MQREWLLVGFWKDFLPIQKDRGTSELDEERMGCQGRISRWILGVGDEGALAVVRMRGPG